MSLLIDSYTDALRRSLAFDPQAADRLAAEVEDHLAEAVDREGGYHAADAARAAIRRFGSPQTVAAAYTREMFPVRLKAAWTFALLLGGLVLLSMALRNSLPRPTSGGPVGPDTLVAADDLGFRVAIALTALAFLIAQMDRSGLRFRQVVRALAAGAVAAAVSVGAGLVLAAASVASLGLSGTTAGWSLSALLSLVLLAALLGRLRLLKAYVDLFEAAGTS